MRWLRWRQLGDATSRAGQRAAVPLVRRQSKPALKRPTGATQRKVASHSPANPPGKYHPAGVMPETISELLSGSIGLELVKTKVSQPFLTIVRVEKPTPN